MVRATEISTGERRVHGAIGGFIAGVVLVKLCGAGGRPPTVRRTWA